LQPARLPAQQNIESVSPRTESKRFTSPPAQVSANGRKPPPKLPPKLPPRQASSKANNEIDYPMSDLPSENPADAKNTVAGGEYEFDYGDA